MKATLYLMTKKGVHILNTLIEHKFQDLISEVIIGRDKNVENDFAEEIISICKIAGIKHYERTENFVIQSEYSIAISWRWIISSQKSKLIVLHDSILPKYRGFAPLVNMLCNGEKEIGVTAIFANEEYDKGEIIAQSKTQINYPIKIADAIEMISKDYSEVVLNIFNSFISQQEIKSYPQDEELASYSLWRDEEDYLIDWGRDARDILYFINAVSSPYKGATSYLNGQNKVRILEAELENDVQIENRDVGKVIFIKENMPVIVCKTGLIKITRLIDDQSQKNLLPLKSFRVRLSSFKY